MTEKMRDRSRARQGSAVPVAHAGFGAFGSRARPGVKAANRFPKKYLIAAMAGVAFVAAAIGYRVASEKPLEPAARVDSGIAPRTATASAAVPASAEAAAPAPATSSAPAVAVVHPASAPVALTQPAADAPKTAAQQTLAEDAAKPGRDAAGSATADSAAEKGGKSGTLALAIVPWGEIFVDGHERGVSPPLKSLNLTPGKHQIMVRNGTFAPYKQTVDVQSGATTNFHYAF